MIDWIQALTIIGSVIIPMMAGFGWMIHRMDAQSEKIDSELKDINNRLTTVENRLIALEMRVGFIEKLFEMARWPLRLDNQERTDP